MLIDLSVWEWREALWSYTYRSEHLRFMQRRREWFEPLRHPHLVMWSIPEGTIPTVPEAMDRLRRLREEGPGPEAFTFRRADGGAAPGTHLTRPRRRPGTVAGTDRPGGRGAGSPEGIPGGRRATRRARERGCRMRGATPGAGAGARWPAAVPVRGAGAAQGPPPHPHTGSGRPRRGPCREPRGRPFAQERAGPAGSARRSRPLRQQRGRVPPGRGRGQEVGQVLVQAAAHRGQPHRAAAQRLVQAVDAAR